MKFVGWCLYELYRNFPTLVRMRSQYRNRKIRQQEPITVAWFGDNMDEINGIAIASRRMADHFRSQGHSFFLLGTAFHTNPGRFERPDGSIFMIPGRCSMDEPGYPHSEVALPRLDILLPYLARNPIDIIDFQTPSAGAFLVMIAAKVIGIPTISQYRTDILQYAPLLVKNPVGWRAIYLWTVLLTRWAGPVIVPSESYRQKVHEKMRIDRRAIFKLPRGVDTSGFHPDKAANGAWQRHHAPHEGIRLLYVGRMSEEKNLHLLAQIFPRLQQRHPDLSLTMVGEGPFRKELESALQSCDHVHFTGVLKGDELAGIYASADIFLFPSVTDTFGNTVVEALASGVPCVVSDKGGPCEIVTDACGLIFAADSPQDFQEKVDFLIRNPNQRKELKAGARQRAMQFDFLISGKAYWQLYTRLHQLRYKQISR